MANILDAITGGGQTNPEQRIGALDIDTTLLTRRQTLLDAWVMILRHAPQEAIVNTDKLVVASNIPDTSPIEIDTRPSSIARELAQPAIKIMENFGIAA